VHDIADNLVKLSAAAASSEPKLNFVLTLPSHQEIVFTVADADIIATAAHPQ
jgi:hypothetical protein